MHVCWRREFLASLLFYNYQLQYKVFTALNRTFKFGGRDRESTSDATISFWLTVNTILVSVQDPLLFDRLSNLSLAIYSI